MYEEKRSFDWVSLIVGILFILVSLLAFKNPGVSLVGLVIYFAITAIINGIHTLVIRRRIKNITGYKPTVMIVLGIIELAVGVVFLFNLNAGLFTLAFLFALWFISDSIRNLFFLEDAKLVSQPYYWFSLIMNILGIILGFSLLVRPIVSMLTLSFMVGFYFMMSGIIYIVGSFSK